MFRVYVNKKFIDAKHHPRFMNYSSLMNNRPTPSDNLAENLRMLMQAFGINSNRDLARQSGVSDRMIGRILNRESSATVDIVEKLGRPFGLTGWEMIMPKLHLDLLRSGKLERLIENYYMASDEGRDLIDHIAEREAKYRVGE